MRFVVVSRSRGAPSRSPRTRRQPAADTRGSPVRAAPRARQPDYVALCGPRDPGHMQSRPRHERRVAGPREEMRTLARSAKVRGATTTAGRFGRPVEERPERLYAPEARSDHLPPMEYRDMPEPLPLRKVLGPSVILAGVGVGSGEYILWPYISANAGLGFLWLAFVGVTIQYFLNMEIERYTLATGETAIAGFARSWKPWGILFCAFAVVPNIWPGWGTAGATTFTYIFGGNPNVIALIVLLAIGVSLTTSPIVYRFVEGAEFFKVGLTIVFLAIAITAAIGTDAWGDLKDNGSNLGTLPTGSVAVATLLAGLVFAGAGGANNLVQSNWIREKGFGMGAYIPKIESPLTGEPEPAPTTGFMVKQDEENIKRYKKWFNTASKEQLVSFWAICIASII